MTRNLLHRQRRGRNWLCHHGIRPEVGLVLPLDVLFALVRAVEWRVGIDPGADLDELCLAELGLAVSLEQLLHQQAAMRAEAHRWFQRHMGATEVRGPQVTDESLIRFIIEVGQLIV